MKQLNVILLGLRDVGAEYLTAIQADEQFLLVAVADGDAEVVRHRTEGTSLPGYTDFRSIIVETARTGLDAMVVALEPFQSHEYVELAARHGIAVFHKAPVARNMTEGRRLVEHFMAGGCPLVVSRPWQFEPVLSGLRRPSDLIGRVYAAGALVRTTSGPIGWRGDSHRAGGGVLLGDAYEQIDMLVHLMGLPEFVMAQCSHALPPGAVRNYDTEDAAQLLLRFSDERMATMAAARQTWEPFCHVTLVGERGTIDVYPDRMIVQRPQTKGRECFTVQTHCRVGPAITAFGAARLAGVKKIASTVEEHLPTLAVIEAAYLSAKTGAPESPGRFLNGS